MDNREYSQTLRVIHESDKEIIIEIIEQAFPEIADKVFWLGKKRDRCTIESTDKKFENIVVTLRQNKVEIELINEKKG